MSTSRSMDYKITQIARRFVVLLRRSNWPMEEMQEASLRLSRAGLVEIPVGAGMTPEKFAAQVEESPEVRQALANMGIEFHPQLIESVDELVSHLLPSDGHLD